MLAALLLVSGAINASHLPEPEPRSCNIEVEGESYQSLMLTNTNEEYQISLHGYCHLRILLVGGGGQGNTMNSGGGSGYLKYYEVTLLESSVVAKVGNHGEPSTVTVNGATIIAESGGEGEHIKGGDGYCGGGDWDNWQGNNGGFAGGNGEGGVGGAGTGENISSYVFNSWSLSPGKWGNHYWYSYAGNHNYFGGGGGGVLVNEEGPFPSVFQGQGYGGGSNGYFEFGNGLPGVILIEAFSE